MDHRHAVLDELHMFRADMLLNEVPYRNLLQLTLWRPVRDIALDWLLILLAVATVHVAGWWWAPLAILVIGNRQRALGNILHDAGHRNLHRSAAINDSLAVLWVAPLLFVCLRTYRATHLRHHLFLGDPSRDPDYLVPPSSGDRKWTKSFARNLFSLRTWCGSLAGHLGAKGASIEGQGIILGWWAIMSTLACIAVGARFTVMFVVLWLIARATVFHLITVFREMCDHHGLDSGGVISFTRDIVQHDMWSLFFHPRNNGYHLTHHLLPTIPYYSLPEAYRLISPMPMYRRFHHAFTSYFGGPEAVVSGWIGKKD